MATLTTGMLFYLQRAFIRDIERLYLCSVKTQLQQNKIALGNINRLQTDNTETKPMMSFTIMVMVVSIKYPWMSTCVVTVALENSKKSNNDNDVFCKIGSLPVARFIPCSMSLYVESCNLNSKIKKKK